MLQGTLDVLDGSNMETVEMENVRMDAHGEGTAHSNRFGALRQCQSFIVPPLKQTNGSQHSSPESVRIAAFDRLLGQSTCAFDLLGRIIAPPLRDALPVRIRRQRHRLR